MKKRADFLPTSLKADNFDEVKGLLIGTEYLDGTDRLKLMMPDKAFNKTGRWHL